MHLTYQQSLDIWHQQGNHMEIINRNTLYSHLHNILVSRASNPFTWRPIQTL